MEKRFDGKKMVNVYSGKKDGKLGSKNNPAKVSVKSEQRAGEVREIFVKNDWEYELDINPKEDEDINDLNLLLDPVKTIVSDDKVGRNDPCPCGSGKKYKMCCGK